MWRKSQRGEDEGVRLGRKRTEEEGRHHPLFIATVSVLGVRVAGIIKQTVKTIE